MAPFFHCHCLTATLIIRNMVLSNYLLNWKRFNGSKCTLSLALPDNIYLNSNHVVSFRRFCCFHHHLIRPPRPSVPLAIREANSDRSELKHAKRPSRKINKGSQSIPVPVDGQLAVPQEGWNRYPTSPRSGAQSNSPKISDAYNGFKIKHRPFSGHKLTMVKQIWFDAWWKINKIYLVMFVKSCDIYTYACRIKK